MEGIFVSNHGARQLDTVPATIDALPAIVAAVDGRAEVHIAKLITFSRSLVVFRALPASVASFQLLGPESTVPRNNRI